MPSSTPMSHWIGFHLFLLLLLAAEYLLAAPQRRARENIDSPANPSTLANTHFGGIATRTAVRSTILWIAAALAFGLYVYLSLGPTSTTEYLAGYAIEESLSIDNLFVFLLLFGFFRIEAHHQPRVLFWGVAGAIVMRGLFIAAGIGLLTRFQWVSYIFALILLGAAIRLLVPETKKPQEGPLHWLTWLRKIHPVSLRQDRFFTVEQVVPGEGRPQLMVTMLFLTLLGIELTDLVFALDSIPAVLSVTRHPFLAYTSNIMAVMGLRSLFFIVIHLLQRLRFLHYGLAAVLAFAAIKMLSTRWIEIGPLASLGVILALLGVTVAVSLLRPQPGRGIDPRPGPHPAEKS